LATRQEFLAGIGAEESRVLVVTEGLLAYLDEAEVGSLADDLRRSFPAGLWILENVSPAVLKRMRRMWGKTLHTANAEMKFAPADGLAFFRSPRWVPRTTKSLLDEAERLNREMPIVSLIRFLSSMIPPLKTIYARQEAKVRESVVYALMEPLSS